MRSDAQTIEDELVRLLRRIRSAVARDQRAELAGTKNTELLNGEELGELLQHTLNARLVFLHARYRRDFGA